MPLCVTEAARDELIELLERSDQPAGRVPRFVVRGDRLKLTLDQRRRGDARVDHAGRTVLVLDPAVAGLLDDQQLDRIPPNTGRLTLRGLTLTNQTS